MYSRVELEKGRKMNTLLTALPVAVPPPDYTLYTKCLTVQTRHDFRFADGSKSQLTDYIQFLLKWNVLVQGLGFVPLVTYTQLYLYSCYASAGQKYLNRKPYYNA